MKAEMKIEIEFIKLTGSRGNQLLLRLDLIDYIKPGEESDTYVKYLSEYTPYFFVKESCDEIAGMVKAVEK